MWPWIVSESSESQSLDQKVQRAKKYNKAHVYLWKREKEYQRETRCINLSKKQKFIWEIKSVSKINSLFLEVKTSHMLAVSILMIVQ